MPTMPKTDRIPRSIMHNMVGEFVCLSYDESQQPWLLDSFSGDLARVVSQSGKTDLVYLDALVFCPESKVPNRKDDKEGGAMIAPMTVQGKVWYETNLWCRVGELVSGGQRVNWSEWTLHKVHVSIENRIVKVFTSSGHVTARAKSCYPEHEFFLDDKQNEFWQFAACNLAEGDND